MSDPLNSKKIKIAIVAGEKSGDELGGPLMESLKTHFQDITFIGVGGEKMQVQGLLPLFPMDKISVMGIIEPLLKLKELPSSQYVSKWLVLSSRERFRAIIALS